MANMEQRYLFDDGMVFVLGFTASYDYTNGAIGIVPRYVRAEMGGQSWMVYLWGPPPIPMVGESDGNNNINNSNSNNVSMDSAHGAPPGGPGPGGDGQPPNVNEIVLPFRLPCLPANGRSPVSLISSYRISMQVLIVFCHPWSYKKDQFALMINGCFLADGPKRTPKGIY